MYTHHRSFIHNSQKLKIILMSVKTRMVKSVGLSIQWLTFGNLLEQSMVRNMNESWKSLCWVREVYRKQHTGWYHLYEVLEWQKQYMVENNQKAAASGDWVGSRKWWVMGRRKRSMVLGMLCILMGVYVTCIWQSAWDDSLKICAFNFMQILPQGKKSK